ncbi:hypothetical protein Efla_007820 [Eimeria flavescens]
MRVGSASGVRCLGVCVFETAAAANTWLSYRIVLWGGGFERACLIECAVTLAEPLQDVRRAKTSGSWLKEAAGGRDDFLRLRRN